ncbi:KH domain-containing, RNA-binding, signal transduction-associated protein 1 [Anabrus simplex]|uniref:KH domain-containing, RNA-binding, signal transduction-associated protein 1 n=1 Tax=Anabrus simplex TaxID=316456 RepID=UPI0034DD8D33
MEEDRLSEGNTSVPTQVSSEMEQQGAVAAYLKQLLAEKQRLEEQAGGDGCQFTLTQKLVAIELERLQNGGRPLSANSSSSSSSRPANEERRFADIIKEKPIKVTVRVLVPVKEHPKFNFVGKLLGPKGNSLKRLQEDTMTKMAVLGRGSMRDKNKEEELRASADPKYAHFNDDLHVEITAFAPPAEAHARIAYALSEVRKFMVPDYNDEIRQEQMREMQILNTPGIALASPAAEVVVPTSGASPAPSSSPKSSAASQNGRSLPTAFTQAAAAVAASNGRSAFLYSQPQPQPQQLLLHPAFRGLTARAHGVQLPGAPGDHYLYRGSILNRLRAPLAAGITTPTSRLSPGGGVLSKQHRNSILSILAGGPRTLIAATQDGGAEQVMVCEDEDAVPTPQAPVYSLYDNYAAAAAAAVSGTGCSPQGTPVVIGPPQNGDVTADSPLYPVSPWGVLARYGLLESFANGNGILTADTMEDIAANQEAVNGPAAVTPDISGRSDAGAVKVDRTRFRHDPYARYATAGVKLPL